jgi:hypothetical protein
MAAAETIKRTQGDWKKHFVIIFLHQCVCQKYSGNKGRDPSPQLQRTWSPRNNVAKPRQMWNGTVFSGQSSQAPNNNNNKAFYSQTNWGRLPTKDKIKTPWRCQRFLIKTITKSVTLVRPGDRTTEPQAPPNCFSLDSVLRKEFFKTMIKHHLSIFIYNSSLLMSLKFDVNSEKNLPAPTCSTKTD